MNATPATPATPAPPRDHYEVLGIERRYHVAPDELERRFHEQSRLLHPDRHMKAEPQARVKTALATSQLNQAYRTLRDPVRRAEYLVGLEGIALSDERSGHKVAPAFLLEILELREALADAKAEGNRAQVAALGADVARRRAEAMASADAGFARYDAGDRGALPAVADQLVAERYFRRFLDEVEAFDEATAAAAAADPAAPGGVRP